MGWVGGSRGPVAPSGKASATGTSTRTATSNTVVSSTTLSSTSGSSTAPRQGWCERMPSERVPEPAGHKITFHAIPSPFFLGGAIRGNKNGVTKNGVTRNLNFDFHTHLMVWGPGTLKFGFSVEFCVDSTD